MLVLVCRHSFILWYQILSNIKTLAIFYWIYMDHKLYINIFFMFHFHFYSFFIIIFLLLLIVAIQQKQFLLLVVVFYVFIERRYHFCWPWLLVTLIFYMCFLSLYWYFLFWSLLNLRFTKWWWLDSISLKVGLWWWSTKENKTFFFLLVSVCDDVYMAIY